MRYQIWHNLDSNWSRPADPNDHLYKGYGGEIAPSEKGIIWTLETIWATHNADDRPDRWEYPSLSVGDVVVVWPENEEFGQCWTVDIISFAQIDPPIDRRERKPVNAS